MKALLLQSLRIKGKRLSPSNGRSTFVDIDEDEFDKLKELGVIRALTSDEAKLAAIADGEEPATKRGRKPKADETKVGEGGSNPNPPNPDDL